MASFTKNANLSQICSKDHQSREKNSIEKRMQLLKKPMKRIPATQKFVYTFDELLKTANEKEKSDDQFNEDTKFSLETVLNKKTKHNHWKPEENSTSVKNLQLSDIEKQLKLLQSHKKKINQLIAKELREPTSSWQEVKSKSSLLNMRNVVNDFSFAKRLCSTLEESSKQVDSLKRSLDILDEVKANQCNVEAADGKFKLTCTGEHESEELKQKLTNVNEETLENKKIETVANIVNDQYSTMKMFEHLSVSTSPRKNDFTYRDQFDKIKRDAVSTDKYEKLLKSCDFRSDQTIDKNCNVASQAETSNPGYFTNKHLQSNSKLPDISKSEFLRKTYYFD